MSKNIKATEQEYILHLKNGETIYYKPDWERATTIAEEDIEYKEKVDMLDSVIVLNRKCQLDCFFCRDGRGTVEVKEDITTDAKIEAILSNQKDTVSFEGGEPTLSKEKLLKWVKFAKNKGVKDIILVTNAILLHNKEYCKELIDAGVELFNINVQAYNNEQFTDIYQSNSQLLKLRNKGIQNLIELGYGKHVRFNFVINKKNYSYLLNYAVWVYKTFPEIFYVEMNFVKVLGKVIDTKNETMPSYPDIEKNLQRMLKFCKKVGLKVIVEGIPLCYLKGFEHLNIDVSKHIKGDFTFFAEKEKSDKCQGCKLHKLCTGARLNYFSYYGEQDLKPVDYITIDQVIENYHKPLDEEFLFEKY